MVGLTSSSPEPSAARRESRYSGQDCLRAAQTLRCLRTNELIRWAVKANEDIQGTNYFKGVNREESSIFYANGFSTVRM